MTNDNPYLTIGRLEALITSGLGHNGCGGLCCVADEVARTLNEVKLPADSALAPAPEEQKRIYAALGHIFTALGQMPTAYRGGWHDSNDVDDHMIPAFKRAQAALRGPLEAAIATAAPRLSQTAIAAIAKSLTDAGLVTA